MEKVFYGKPPRVCMHVGLDRHGNSVHKQPVQGCSHHCVFQCKTSTLCTGRRIRFVGAIHPAPLPSLHRFITSSSPVNGNCRNQTNLPFPGARTGPWSAGRWASEAARCVRAPRPLPPSCASPDRTRALVHRVTILQCRQLSAVTHQIKDLRTYVLHRT
jgi:hypothetical protein